MGLPCSSMYEKSLSRKKRRSGSASISYRRVRLSAAFVVCKQREEERRKAEGQGGGRAVVQKKGLLEAKIKLDYGGWVFRPKLLF